MHRVKLTTNQHTHLNDTKYLMRIGIAHYQRIAADRAKIVAAIRAAAIDHVASGSVVKRALRQRCIEETRRLIDQTWKAGVQICRAIITRDEQNSATVIWAA